jgi:hypothetical protein
LTSATFPPRWYAQSDLNQEGITHVIKAKKEQFGYVWHRSGS